MTEAERLKILNHSGIKGKIAKVRMILETGQQIYQPLTIQLLNSRFILLFHNNPRDCDSSRL